MRALELYEASRFRIRELEAPSPRADEVLIRVRACGICGSDIHGMDGSTGRRIPPIVMGHEAAGEIVEVGSEAPDWSVGDRVTFDSTIFCGECAFCKTGQVNLCDNRQVIGVSCGDYRRHGAFAEYVAVPSRVLAKLPDNLSYREAAMVEPVSVALHSVHRVAPLESDRVVVIGAGMIGLLIVQTLKAYRVHHVTAVDIDPEKRSMALELGADEVLENAEGLDFDVALEAVGITPTVEMAFLAVRKGGRIGLVGNLSPTVTLPLQIAVTRELTVYGSCASQGDYPESLELIASGAVRVAPLISCEISLEEAPSYFQRLHAKEPGLVKVMVCP